MLKRALLIAAVTAFSSNAFAADLLSPIPAYEWAGAYFGANVSYGSGSAGSGVLALGGLGGGSTGLAGWGGGLQAGYNWETGNGVVFGLQGDADWLNETGTVGETISPGGGLPATIANTTDTVNWAGAATGRLGFSFGSFLPYALAGVAIANNTSSLTESTLGTAFSSSDTQTHVGYTVGAGLEAELTDKLTGFVEGRYSNYGTANYTFTEPAGLGVAGTVTEGVNLQDTSIRTGLNFHF